MPLPDETPPPEHFISWHEIHKACDILAERLRGAGPLEDGAWEGLIAITRGGLVPTALLARALDIRRIDTLCIVSYDDRARGAEDILKKPEAAGDGTGWIVVDDLADSGQTLRTARNLLPGAVYVCLYAKPEGAPHADIFLEQRPQGTWIVFPWESPASDATKKTNP